MLSTRPNFPRPCLTIVLALVPGACAPHAPLSRSDAPSQEQRLSDLERRVENLEARPQLEPPFRNKAEIQAHIKSLEAERGKLLSSYTAQHPAIRDIDRRLAILDKQLKMLRAVPPQWPASSRGM